MTTEQKIIRAKVGLLELAKAGAKLHLGCSANSKASPPGRSASGASYP